MGGFGFNLFWFSFCVTRVTTGTKNVPKSQKLHIKALFFLPKGPTNYSACGRSPLQKLEKGLDNGPCLLLKLKGLSKVC